MGIFTIEKSDKKSFARAGYFETAHGRIETPVFMPVGTQATVKGLTPKDLEEIGAQIILGNTYHLYLRPGADLIQKFGGLHTFENWQHPILTDSGGFQVFSLGLGHNKRRTDIIGKKVIVSPEGVGQPEVLAKIDEEGVTFQSHIDGAIHRFTPEVSIQIQHKIGADIILSFDECAPYPASVAYTKAALDRTHRWAKRSLKEHQEQNTVILNGAKRSEESFRFTLRVHLERVNPQHESPKVSVQPYGILPDRQDDRRGSQLLFGIVQGGVYENLRKESARFVGSQDFDGICVGGVSVGEPKPVMYQVCEWVIPLLPEEKPRHLLGIGDIDDLFNCIKRGMDMFDCVSPTRLARNGSLYISPQSSHGSVANKFRLNILNAQFKEDKEPIDKNCLCYVCQNFSRAYLRHLFVASELLAYRLASYHNVYFVVHLVKDIREAILEDRLPALEANWLS